jgi:integral membrane protein
LVFIGVPLQYAANQPAVAETVGPLHGALYIVYLATAVDLARRARFTIWQLAGMVFAGFIPFLAFFVEHRVVLRMRSLEAEAASPDPAG